METTVSDVFDWLKELLEVISPKSLEEVEKMVLEAEQRGEGAHDVLLMMVDVIRLHIKYLLFDLESATREKAFLKRLLEEQ